MSIIGEQIKKYRIKMGYTQEQLGQIIGVTTQAVSKWERGGLPDTELLPRIAHSLGINIDTLFGDDDENELLNLARQINRLPVQEAYRYAFEICWAIEIGLMRDYSLIEKFVNFFSEGLQKSAVQDNYYSKILTDGGISTARISPDFRHFFLMTEPGNSLLNQLSDPEALRRVRGFRMKNACAFFQYVYAPQPSRYGGCSHSPKPVSAKRIWSVVWKSCAKTVLRRSLRLSRLTSKRMRISFLRKTL